MRCRNNFGDESMSCTRNIRSCSLFAQWLQHPTRTGSTFSRVCSQVLAWQLPCSASPSKISPAQSKRLNGYQWSRTLTFWDAMLRLKSGTAQMLQLWKLPPLLIRPQTSSSSTLLLWRPLNTGQAISVDSRATPLYLQDSLLMKTITVSSPSWSRSVTSTLGKSFLVSNVAISVLRLATNQRIMVGANSIRCVSLEPTCSWACVRSTKRVTSASKEIPVSFTQSWWESECWS